LFGQIHSIYVRDVIVFVVWTNTLHICTCSYCIRCLDKYTPYMYATLLYSLFGQIYSIYVRDVIVFVVWTNTLHICTCRHCIRCLDKYTPYMYATLLYSLFGQIHSIYVRDVIVYFVKQCYFWHLMVFVDKLVSNIWCLHCF